MPGMYALSADVGGTFTDLVLFDTQSSTLYVDKILSTPGCTTSITDGIARILASAGAGTGDLGMFVHGFTIATNAWLTRRGARVALLVTEGFADILEIGSQRRPKLYSLTAKRPPPLVARTHVVEVSARVDAFGGVVRDLTEEALRDVVERTAAIAPEAVAINLIFGHLHPHHEERLAAALSARLSGVPVYMSCEINPQAEEYPRASTTVMTAYVGPAVDRYLAQLELALPAHGVTAPLLLMRSDGGVATPQAARENPGHMLLSGPAGGVVAAAALGRLIGVGDIVTFDMGGTSADFSLIHGGGVPTATERMLGGEPLRLPSIDIETISAGGGSIGSVDLGGAVRVGPDSAGSSPGPACYGRGGARPTLTDAMLVLGILSPTDYLDGEITLDVEAACDALRRDVATPLGIPVEDAAFAMVTIANAQMAAAIRSLSVERGHDVRRFALLSFGGAGSMFAPFLAEDLEMAEILVPPRPGVFAALGLLLSDIRHTAQSQFLAKLADVEPPDVRRRIAAMRAKLDEALERDGVAAASRGFAFSADIRAVGQFHELSVEIPSEGAAWNPAAIAAEFHRSHERVYGHADPALPCEIVNLRAEATGIMTKPGFLESRQPTTALGPPAPIGHRDVYLGAEVGVRPFALYRRDALHPGDTLTGPAIVTQRDTTVVLLPGQNGTTSPEGVLRITRGR